MTILQEIHAWSKGLHAWQQDAIARIYANRELSTTDVEDLYALSKAEAGIEDPQNRAPKALDDAQVATRADPTRLVRLLAIKEISNVNALAAGGSLPIAETGLTVIYGENGAGKSGYSRVLKHACRARDQREAEDDAQHAVDTADVIFEHDLSSLIIRMVVGRGRALGNTFLT